MVNVSVGEVTTGGPQKVKRFTRRQLRKLPAHRRGRKRRWRR